MTRPLHIEPVPGDFCGLDLSHDAFPQDRIRFWFPEGIVYYDDEGVFHIIDMGRSRPHWTRSPAGVLSHRRRWEIVEYEVSAIPAGETLELRATVTNVSPRPLHRVDLAPCVQLASAPSLDDTSMTRTFYRAQGRFLAIADADRPNDPRKNQVSVTPDLGFRWTLGEAEISYGWGLASPDADAGFIAVLGADPATAPASPPPLKTQASSLTPQASSLFPRSALATYWARAATLANNSASPIHCVHAEPYFDTLAPGASSSNSGELLWRRQSSLEDLWQRFLDFRL
ncbi:MAG: hypothetical protein V2A58_08510 [Planctomycetota bacterium]